ncbi:FecR family protein [Sunxiuqinia sp. A32]|uniref:FecR family protein n=1 Tax=Sunxiuqinia sp. A32 TaxID=3461496 RepID=UPI004046620E
MTNIEKENELISKVISGNATEDEVLRLNRWLSESEENRKIYRDSKNAWKNSETWIAPGNIQQDKLKIVSEINRRLLHESVRNRKRSIVYLVAAILAFPIAIALSNFFISGPSLDVHLAVSQVSSPNGHISKCILPDGTVVWINSESTITYNAEGFAEGTREVKLEGEAYFDVTKNEGKPFYVRTNLADVRVTGTSFNVKAYSDSKLFETVLKEGSIELELGGRDENQKIKIKPGERAIFEADQKKLLIQNVDARIYSAWRNGQLIFKDATLNDLIKELERIYEVEFKLNDPELGNYRFRGTFSYDNNLIKVLEKFKVTAQIDYYIRNNEVWLTKNN